MRTTVLSVLGPLAAALLAAAPPGAARDVPPLPTLDVPRWSGPAPRVDGRLDESGWSAAAVVDTFAAPWWTEGVLEATAARLAWDDTALYVAFEAADVHVSATQDERDDPVSRDDCVEVFFAPDPDSVHVYFNYEINALGTILDRSPRDGRTSAWDAAGLTVAVTVDGTRNDDSDTDAGWVTEIVIPFADLAPYGARPAPGATWRLNLYRIQDASNRQYRTWSDTGTERPQFHAPERFGIVRFLGPGEPQYPY